jgi:uncharacterized SAM-binding protein YcdF (DUF218 family)
MKRWTAAFALAVTVLVWAVIFHRISVQIESEPISAWTSDHKADCAVVVTGGPGRVREGLDLLAQGQVHKLIISGVHPRSTLREIYPQWPFYGTLRDTDVVLERRSTTTYGNAQQSLPLVEAMHCRSVVLVTSQIHMQRAYKTFRQIFPPEILIAKRAISSGAVPPRPSDVAIEALKSMFYSLWAY